MPALATRPDPENCQHAWELVLNLTGRPVELVCPRCSADDQDVWPPGGIADLVTLELPEDGIKVQGARHNATRNRIISVDLQVRQSASFQKNRFGFSGLVTTTNVTVTVRK